MLSKHLFSSLACVAMLGGCASAPPPAPAPKAPPTVASFIKDAEAAIASGDNERAVSLLKSAAVAYPKEKEPRLRAAQLQFDCHNYGEAITHAREVLDRDPDDMTANSIMAASGLRVSSKALADLAAKNNLSGTVRAEAQDLVKVVRAHIKGDIIPTADTFKTKNGGGRRIGTPTSQVVKAPATPMDEWLKNK